MSQVARPVPEENQLLCEGCGYLLEGLPAEGNCPECGMPLEKSQEGRLPPPWEAADASGTSRLLLFLRTTGSILFQPTRFFRTLATRSDSAPARRFAMVHWAIASILFGLTARAHVNWYVSLGAPGLQIHWIGLALLIAAGFAFLWGTTRIAAALTAWEARYRGLRLPARVVQRGLFYHAAHYLPVALMAFCTVEGFMLISQLHPLAQAWAAWYLYVLCGEVIVAAAYLFNTYWIGMRNMMYANR